MLLTLKYFSALCEWYVSDFFSKIQILPQEVLQSTENRIVRMIDPWR